MIDLKEYDKKFEGKLNPRNTFQCPICMRYYNGDSVTTLIFDDVSSMNECVHGADKEITESIYKMHIDTLIEDGLLDETEMDLKQDEI